MRELKIISCVENKIRFCWEVDSFLATCKEYNTQILIYHNSPILPEWHDVELKYPNVKFFFYRDTDGITSVSKNINYIPLLRPYILKKHWEKFPELEKDAIFYCDSDILFLKPLDFSPFLQDDINYLSNTESYLNSVYFDSKEKDVLPNKLADYKKIDVLDSAAKICGINREICEKNNSNTGGAQYLLKNITADFWNDVLENSCSIRIYLSLVINKEFFEGEEMGIQGWCADMFAVLWNLWKRNQETRCPKELDFCWATDEIKETDTYYLMHNAGITGSGVIRITERTKEGTVKSVRDENNSPIYIDAPAFFKGNYNASYPEKQLLETIAEHPISKKYYTSLYSKHLLNTIFK